jgi:hypothetical protein
MTVYTKAALQPGSDHVKKVLPVAVRLQGDNPGGDSISPARSRCFPVLCLILLVLWLLIASFASGILFYRYIYRRPTFYGWCGANIVENGHAERLEQQLEIDPEQV